MYTCRESRLEIEGVDGPVERQAHRGITYMCRESRVGIEGIDESTDQ